MATWRIYEHGEKPVMGDRGRDLRLQGTSLLRSGLNVTFLSLLNRWANDNDIETIQ